MFYSYPNQVEISELLVSYNLAKKEVGEKIVFGEEPHQYYIKYVKERNVPGMRVSQVNRAECQPLGQHPASLTTRRFENQDGSNTSRDADDDVPNQASSIRIESEDGSNPDTTPRISLFYKVMERIREEAEKKSMKERAKI